MERLTKEQAAIIGAFTGFLAGPFSEMHEYIEKIMGGPVWTHQLGNAEFAGRVKEAARADFLAIVRQAQ